MMRPLYPVRPARLLVLGILALASAALLLLVTPASSALALTLTVTQTADAADPTPDGVCDVDASMAGNQCSLRAAVQTANFLGGSITIDIPTVGTYTLTVPGTTEDKAVSGDLDIKTGSTITIRNTSGGTVAIDGNNANPANADRVFDVLSGGTLTLIGLTVQHGQPEVGTDGGGIRSNGTLTLLDVIVDQNSVSALGMVGHGGGGVFSEGGGTTTLIGSAVTSNTALQGFGGGILAKNSLVLTNVLVDHNTVQAVNVAGGGIAIFSPGSLTATDTTISNNGATASNGGGGGIFAEGSITLTRVTVSGNTAGNTGGNGIYLQASSTVTHTLTNVTISGNTGGIRSLLVEQGGSGTLTARLRNVTVGPISGGGSDVLVSAPGTVGTAIIEAANTLFAASCSLGAGSASFTDSGGNVRDFASSNATCPGTSAANVASLLGTLGDNGGFTQTQALDPMNPAKGAGLNCPANFTDQRGVPRANGGVVGACDAGAFEVHTGTLPPVVLAIPNQTIDEDGSTGPLALRFADTNSASPGTNTVTITPSGSLTSSTISQGGTYPNETLTVTPPPDQNGGPLTVQVQVEAAGGGSPTITSFNVTVTAVDDAPQVAGNQTVNEDVGPQTVPGFARPGPATATDEASQTFLVVNVNPTGATGSLAFTSSPTIDTTTGDLTYQTALNTNGTASFQVNLTNTGGTTNGGQNSATQTFTITVNAVNDAPSFTLTGNQTVNEDAGPQTVPGFASGMVTGPAAATDETGQTLSPFTVSVTGTTGNLAFTTPPAIDLATGTLTYQMAPNTSGTATVSMTLSDNGSNVAPNSNTSAPQTFTIAVNAVNAVNAAPVAVADAYAALPNGTTTVAAPGVLANDTDVDVHTLTAALVSNPIYGSLNLQPNGGFSYTPNPGYTGPDSFSYKPNDGTVDGNTVNVTLTVGGSVVSIGDVTVSEGNSGTKQADFAVTLSPASTATVTVQVATANGTAQAGSDYTAVGPTTVTFTPGTTSQTFSVPILGDTAVEPDETFTVTLSSPTNAAIGKAQATGTLQNDDAYGDAIALVIEDATVTEGNSGTTSATFTVSMNRVSTSPVTVQYATGDGTATTADTDYSAASGTLTFNPGELTKTLTVAVTGDAKVEPTETFTVTLTSPTNAALARAQGIGTIQNDDIGVASACSPRPDVAVASKATGDGRLQVTITAGTAGPNGANRLAELRFGAGANALVDVAGQTGKSGAFSVPLTDHPASLTFFVRRATPGQATTVPLTIVDSCGDWPTLVGGGPSAF